MQINSGCGLELLSEERCYKLSMISVEDIKSHIIENIPKYFYIYSSNDEDYIGTDARTQVMIFNEKKIFDTKSNKRKENNIMNITIGMFHESGNEKFHMNSEVGGDRSPVNCVNKTFDFTKKKNWNDPERGESGKFIDHFLYNSNNDEVSIKLISSLRSNELMKKSYFVNDLKELNKAANDIVPNDSKKNNQGLNIDKKDTEINNVSTLSSKFGIKTRLNNEEFTRLNDVGGDVYY